MLEARLFSDSFKGLKFVVAIAAACIVSVVCAEYVLFAAKTRGLLPRTGGRMSGK